MYGDLLSLNSPGESGSRSAHDWSILYHRYIDLFLADQKLNLMLTYTSILLLQEVLVFKKINHSEYIIQMLFIFKEKFWIIYSFAILTCL